MKKLILLILTMTVVGLNFSTITAQKTETDVPLPEEAEAFVGAGKKETKFVKADLNGDGTEDYLLVLEEDICREDDYYKTLKRTTVIVIRETKTSFSAATVLTVTKTVLPTSSSIKTGLRSGIRSAKTTVRSSNIRSSIRAAQKHGSSVNLSKPITTFSPIACGRGNIMRRKTSPESILTGSIRRN
jgi:hypothetical protein